MKCFTHHPHTTSPGNDLPASLMSRRHLLLKTPLFVAGWACLRRTGFAQSNVESEASLAARVVAKVRVRESLGDAMQPFRQGAAARIAGVMEQYASVQAEFAGRTPARLLALRWALQVYIDESRRPLYAKAVRGAHVDGSVTSFGAGDLKCNKLVADAYAAGAGCGLAKGTDWHSPGDGTGWPAMKSGDSLWPPQANDLANQSKNLRSLTNARPLRQAGEPKAAPELGDIIAFPESSGSGHVGLYLGKDLIITAKETGVEIHPLAYEQSLHGGVVVIRKFTGTGR